MSDTGSPSNSMDSSDNTYHFSSDMDNISKFDVLMKWNGYKNHWEMMFTDGTFIQEFYNCDNIQKSFPKLYKKIDNYYQISIERLGNGRTS